MKIDDDEIYRESVRQKYYELQRKLDDESRRKLRREDIHWTIGMIIVAMLVMFGVDRWVHGLGEPTKTILAAVSVLVIMVQVLVWLKSR